jgi:hypothetical protein
MMNDVVHVLKKHSRKFFAKLSSAFTGQIAGPDGVKSLSTLAMWAVDLLLRRLISIALDKGDFTRVEQLLALLHFFSEDR